MNCSTDAHSKMQHSSVCKSSIWTLQIKSFFKRYAVQNIELYVTVFHINDLVVLLYKKIVLTLATLGIICVEN